jgi:5'-nucleotidase
LYARKAAEPQPVRRIAIWFAGRTIIRMLILLTNDDGIHAPGIVAMYKALTKLGEVHVIATETVQSATGHGITLATPVMTSKVKVQDTFTGIAVDGRPADCVKLAVNKLLPRMPDLVVSGMNSGANVGINVIYSGTVAAAIEAAFLGLPSIAVSLLLRQPEIPIEYDWTAQIGCGVIEQILAAGLEKGQVASINIPALRQGEQPRGTRLARQCTRPWIDTYEERTSPRGQRYFWNSSVFTLANTEQDTDVAALRDGYVTVTPLQFDMTDHKLQTQWAGKLR